jgi:hypothetical protein
LNPVLLSAIWLQPPAPTKHHLQRLCEWHNFPRVRIGVTTVLTLTVYR